jgi:hypothetical protein
MRENDFSSTSVYVVNERGRDDLAPFPRCPSSCSLLPWLSPDSPDDFAHQPPTRTGFAIIDR